MISEQDTPRVANDDTSWATPEFWEQSASDFGLVVRLHGELTIHHAVDLCSHALSTLHTSTVLHLEDVTYIDAAAAQVFYAWRRSVQQAGSELKIVGTPAAVSDELALVGLAGVLGPEGPEGPHGPDDPEGAAR